MNRLVVIAGIVCGTLAAAACGSSSTAPKDVFSGNWIGTFSNEGASVLVNLNVTQSGSTITGTGTATEGETLNVTVTGTSTPPNVTVNVIIPPGTAGDTLVFVGTYVNADSVAGSVSEGGEVVATGGLKKQ